MLSLQKMIQIQKKHPELLEKSLISEPLLEFLSQTLLGCLYGQQNKQIQDTYSQLSISDIIPKQKNTLIFDLDETLVTTKINPLKADHSFILTIDGETQKINIAIRPYAKEMLEQLSKYYQIIIFTASHLDYAQKVVSFLDPSNTLINFILDRTFCYQTHHGVYIKDLSLFKDFDLSQTLIIDNSSLSYCFQPKNGVPIIEWNGDENDSELCVLAEYLKELQNEGSIVERHSKEFSVNVLLSLYNTLL